MWSQTAPASRAAAPRTIVVWVDSVIRNPTRMENNCRMGRTSLDGSCTAAIDGDTDRAALGQQQSQELFDFGAGLAVPDIGGQRRDFIDDQHNQRFGGGGGVQAGAAAQPLRALLHHGRDGPQ